MLAHLNLKSTPVGYEEIKNMFNYEHQLKFWENQMALEEPASLNRGFPALLLPPGFGRSV